MSHQHHAWSAIRDKRINTIFVDPFEGDLRSSEEFIFTIRRDYPEIVFVLHLDRQASRQQMAELFKGSRNRFKHYFTIKKTSDESSDAKEELAQVLKKCQAWPSQT